MTFLQIIDSLVRSKPTEGFFSNNSRADVIAFVIGFVGFGIAIWQWLDSRKKKDLYDRVFQLTKANLEKEKTEEKLSSRKSELEKISEQLEQIKNEIPKEAKRTILKDKIESAKEALFETHREIKRLKKDLETIGERANIDDNVIRSVEDEIEPRFQLREKSNIVRNVLTLISFVASIGFFFPWPLQYYFPIICYSVAAILGIYLIRLNLKERRYDSKSLFKRLGNIVLLLSALFCTIFGIFFIAIAIANRKSGHSEDFKMPFIFGLAGIVFGVIFGIICYRIYKKR